MAATGLRLLIIGHDAFVMLVILHQVNGAVSGLGRYLEEWWDSGQWYRSLQRVMQILLRVQMLWIQNFTVFSYILPLISNPRGSCISSPSSSTCASLDKLLLLLRGQINSLTGPRKEFYMNIQATYQWYGWLETRDEYSQHFTENTNLLICWHPKKIFVSPYNLHFSQQL